VLQWNPTRSLVDQRLKMAGLSILDCIEQRQPSQLNSYDVCQQLPSVLLW